MMDAIIRVKYADSWIPENWVFEGGDKLKMIPIILSVFLVKKGNRIILVDAGCETMPGLKTANFEGTVAALKKIGVMPQDITDVVITHAHHDHIECVKYFEYATIYIQNEEYMKGMKYIPKHLSVHLFEEECQVTQGVKCIKVGGHTRGSCVVEVIQEEQQYVLCGDECYTFYNLNHKVSTVSCFCKGKSEEFIRRYSSDEYICLLCHDIGGNECYIQ